MVAATLVNHMPLYRNDRFCFAAMLSQWTISVTAYDRSITGANGTYPETEDAKTTHVSGLPTRMKY